jgi:DNA mismatch repair protein MutS
VRLQWGNEWVTVSGQSIVEEYLALARGTEAELVAMQVGDFYEFFADGAELVADELDLKVSQKSSHGSDYPMAGVPVGELTPYLRQLVERGYRVAVADQHETEDGHERRIERVVTPGTLMETTDAEAQYLATVVGEDGEDGMGVALADVTTGRFHVTEVADADAALAELYRFSPAEVLPGPGLRDGDFARRARERTGATVTLHEAAAFAPGRAAHVVREQFGENAAESVGVGELAVRAAGAALDYVAETGGVVGAFSRLRPYRSDEAVALDGTTQRNLELVESMGEGGRTLFETIDHTETAAGGRLLREWLCRPRGDLAELERRAGGVEALADAALAREGLRETLNEAYDLERLASRAVHGSADARDCKRIEGTLALLPELSETVAAAPRLAGSPIESRLDELDGERADALRAELHGALVDDPPESLGAGLFRQGYDDRLDELIERHEELRAWLDGLAAREKDRLGVTHLQVDRNKTDGYYIQVGKSEAEEAPEEYREVKTLKNSRRFVTAELEEREREILRVEEERSELERELFAGLRARVADAAPLLREVGTALAELDTLCSLATHAVENGWVRPQLGGEGLDIEAGRHPVVEQTVEFVPNGVRFDAERGFLVVTGPNMSGKSTYMRQTALIVLLAQIGSFVPAERAEVGLVDGIYTRVGALDELAQGRSTFMVEMAELSNILHSASEDSLVILDEVGRGTATYDGISIAWAATEYLHNEVRAKTLFATHYHELTALADELPRVANVHVAVDERDGGDVTFLRTVEEGPTDRSYGVHVADLAGVPDPVVSRAGDVLERLRAEKAIEAKGGTGETKQAVFDVGAGEFRDGRDASADGGEETDPAVESVLDDLESLDVNEVPPVELMAKVQAWQAELDGE